MTRFAAILLFVAALGGCTTVHVAQPLGDAPVILDPAEWNGTWCDASQLASVPGTNAVSADGADCVVLTVVDAEAGILDVVETDDPGEPIRAHLRRIGDDTTWVYVSTEERGNGYAVALRVYRDGHVLVAWDVAGSAVAEEVTAGRWAGRVKGGDVYLDTPGRDTLARIAADHGGLFTRTPSGVAIRVSGGS